MIRVLLIRPEWNWNVVITLNFTHFLPPFNQTRVELKLWWPNQRHRHRSLLIRPEWNWNRCRYGSQESMLSLLIRPEWNWNFIMVAIAPRSAPSFNQTRVELKLRFYLDSDDYIELLIRPEWNWNIVTFASMPILLSTFNQTRVELKHRIYGVYGSYTKDF